MAFKIKPILTPRQLRRAKFTVAFAAGILCCLGALSHFVGAADEEEEKITWNKQKWMTMEVQEFPRGRIVYFSRNTEVCRSSLLLPGVATLSAGLLAVAYGLCLIYLFLGISIVAEIFMEAIEKITAKKVIVEIKQSDGNTIKKKVDWWNPTVANLTLMALGSSAPEILLAVLETVTNLGQCPGELGASTIVGSASFNLLVISGISVYAVSPETDTDDDRDAAMPLGVKRIYDMRVFAVTCSSSLFAYIWLWFVLRDQYVAAWEGVLTFLYFFVLIGFAYAADKYTAKQNEKEEGAAGPKANVAVIEYSAYEIYKDLIIEQRGNAPQDEASQKKRDKMKRFLKETMNTDQIDKVSLDDLKKIVEGESMISRIKYRKQVNNMMTGKRPVIAKYQQFKFEHAMADAIDDHLKNEDFGFQCLHYSVSESSGQLTIQVINKKRANCAVRAATIDGDAKAGEDYDACDEILEFHGEYSKTISVGIKDDDNWEPDEDFYVQLYDANTNAELVGHDTKTRVTIIDDDKPGQICFQDSKAIKVAPTEEFVEIIIIRKNGSDGRVTVDYETIQLGNQDHVAQEGVHYEGTKGQLVFENQETEQSVKVRIYPQENPDNEDDYSDNAFGFQLSNVTPMGAKLSKKSFQIINIVTDLESKKKQDALAQLIKKLDGEEKETWGSKFITACMLHPTKGEDGEIQDIEAMDGVMHFLTIGWKLAFAFIPPAHYFGGWPCFFISLAFIGAVTYIVGEFANLFGCILNIKPGVTAITFVALGTSLPDTFASMQAAQEEKYADAAVGNVTGSNSVNVFLGLGLPWVIAAIYEESTPDSPSGTNYYVPAGSLGFSVVVFIICAIMCIIVLLARRKVVGGELGGEENGRKATLAFLSSLWLIYILMSILQAYDIGGPVNGSWKEITLGIQQVDASGKKIECPFPKD